MGVRTSKAVRGHAGISLVTQGGHRSYMVSFRIAGRQRTKSFRTLKEAVTFQGAVRDPARARQLKQLETGKITLREYFPVWLERKRDLAPATRRLYADVGEKYIASGLGDLRVSEVTRDDVENWISALEDRGVGRPTIDKAYRTLRACLETAVLEGKALANPARRVAVPPSAEREPFFLTENQVEAIANEVPQRQRALVYFLAYTGVRMGEASALRVKHLSLPQRVVRIVESSAEVAGKKLPAGKTKTRRVRAVQMSEQLVTELADHLEHFGKRVDGVVEPESYVFTGDRGAQIRQNNWRVRIFQQACIHLGIARIGPDGEEVPTVHDLRHTAASLAAKAGYSLHEVKEMLGHSTIKTTSDRYLHLFDDSKRERALSLGELMSAARNDRRETVLTLPRRS